MAYTQELEVALELARRAGEIQLKGQAGVGVERKADDSPVTAVDRECEEVIRDGLDKAFADDGFMGEESGVSAGGNDRVWIVDPLDGTRPFIRGIPTYSSLIALEEAGEPVVGVIHFPALGETYWGSKGGGAFQDGRPLRVSACGAMDRAMGSSLGQIERRGSVQAGRLMALMAEWDYAYGFMDNYSYACVAAGRLDLCVNLLDKAWDCAAAACIVTAAGGTYSDVQGQRTVHNGSIVLSNGVLHDAILAFLQDGG